MPELLRKSSQIVRDVWRSLIAQAAPESRSVSVELAASADFLSVMAERERQKQANDGTLLAARTVMVVGETLSQRRTRRTSVAAPGGCDFHGVLPGGAGGLQHVRLPAARQAGEDRKVEKAVRCPTGAIHQSLVGKMFTEALAEYPAELCEAYAKLVVKAWKLTLQLEWREMVRSKKVEVNALQLKWLQSKEKKQVMTPVQVRSTFKRAWTHHEANADAGPDKKITKRSVREQDNERAIGGMRNPWSSIRRLSKVAEVART